MSSSSVVSDDDDQNYYSYIDGAPTVPKAKRAKRYCSFSSEWKAAEFSVVSGGRTVKRLSGNVLRGKNGDSSAYCTLCKVEFSVRHGGVNDVRKHFSTARHISLVTARNTATLSSYGFSTSSTAKKQIEKQQHKIQHAEALFVQFIVEHNLPFHTGDHFTKLVKSMFPDSEITQHFQCSRTKTSVLSRYGNAQSIHDNLLKKLTQSSESVYYSLLVDESNDRGVEAKDLVIMLRFFDNSIMRAVTRFLALPTANDGTAAKIFEKIDQCLQSHGLSYSNMLCFNSDTCNTMKGQRNGVVKHLRSKQPNLIDFGCICHLENLAIKAALKVLPVNIDNLMVDINTHFYLSIKRKEEFKSFCEFVNVGYKKILSHVETRWLSLLRVIARVLELWPALVSYFTSHPDVDKPGRVKSIQERLCNEVKLYLLFLNFLLPSANAFNVAFQGTSYTTIHLLHPEMRRLTKRILRYFVKLDKIDTNDVTATEYRRSENQLPDAELSVSEGAQQLIYEMIEEGMEDIVSAFYGSVREFYCMFIDTLLKKFPFNSSFLADLVILNPSERSRSDFPDAVTYLAKELPQLQLCDKLDLLKTEAIDFQMAATKDLPETSDVDVFWEKVHFIKRPGCDEPIYSNLLVLIRALLALPASNADSERCFSIVRKIDKSTRSKYCCLSINT